MPKRWYVGPLIWIGGSALFAILGRIYGWPGDTAAIGSLCSFALAVLVAQEVNQ